MSDFRADFSERLKDAGFLLDNRHPIMDGQIHHCSVEGSPGNKSGSYKAYADGVPNGWYQNFKIHDKPERWRSDVRLAPEQSAAMRAQAAQRQIAEAVARRNAQDRAAAEYTCMWHAGSPDTSKHPYLVRKGVQDVSGLRIAGENATVLTKREEMSVAGRLMVPMHNMRGDLRSIQFIDGRGGKMFAPGGEVSGCHLVLGDLKSPHPLHFTEGFVTGLAPHQALGHTVVVTFGAHNLEPVACAYRDRYPAKTIFIDADNDHANNRNVGRDRGEETARRVDGYMLLPPFQSGDKGKDWHDYKEQHGAAGLRRELTNQVAGAQRRMIAREIADMREPEIQTRAMVHSR